MKKVAEFKTLIDMVDWFEKTYNPKDKKAAEILIKGIKGTIIIRIFYEC